ncbi:MAG: radical SAM protein [Chloroflexota bacterium]|nr:radical SAM protein [Chloroflexota bacterium]
MGTAAVLGLCDLQMDAPPTTAYLMLGERCQRNCAFCAQARGSEAKENALSRVVWPPFPPQDVLESLQHAYQEEEIGRACFQVTVSAGYLEQTAQAIEMVSRTCDIPISTSVVPRNVDDVTMFLQSGAERVTIALDAASPRVYRQVKGGTWKKTLQLLQASAYRYPGHVGTHLIVGLGESERDMVERIQDMVDLQVTVGLFALTPIKGTRLENEPPLPLSNYRRVQVARWLIATRVARSSDFCYDSEGRIRSYGPTTAALPRLLARGEAFRTAGCPDCNRPYYNERPGGILYNYPRPLTPGEVEQALKELDVSIDGII